MDSAKLPERIGRLEELANNLWWSWRNRSRKVFRALDYPLWRESGHNPVKQLREVTPERLQAATRDPAFLNLYDAAMEDFDQNMNASTGWFATNHPDLQDITLAYFSMEYAFHNSLPIYAGGLGALAGDICKESSDLGIPMAAVGFMYPQGYFHQRISAEGRQEEIYKMLDFEEAPVNRVLTAEGKPVHTTVQLDDINVHTEVWLVNVGRTKIYLLDTNVEENPERYRNLSARLYIADQELRLQQEIVLGIGGVRILRAMGIKPTIWHANEGHTAFMTLERVREKVAEGKTFTDAAREVRAETIFTTHTPVLSGHDIFPLSLMEKYFRHYWGSLGMDRESFLHLGQADTSRGQPFAFNMTALSLRMAEQRCAVSRLHGKVTRKMWQPLWPDLEEDKIPITHVTNGIHVPSWVAPELYFLLVRYLGQDWMEHCDEPDLWERVWDIPDDELWEILQRLKRKLVGAVRERMRLRWMEEDAGWQQMMARGALLDPDVLTLAFARRFTEYKRPTLLFRDIPRLKKILNSELYPVQIVLAGKSHPADFGSKNLLQQVYNLATDREFQGRIVFVEDYDIHVAHYLVHGVDVWLNTPRRLQEACGTSGMKASLNGSLHFSVPDGWWEEGYNGKNGWVIGTDRVSSPQEEDETDAREIYRLLEEEIVPLYYDRDVSGIPQQWIRRTKEAMASTIPMFCARRMMKEYVVKLYLPALSVKAVPQP